VDGKAPIRDVCRFSEIVPGRIVKVCLLDSFEAGSNDPTPINFDGGSSGPLHKFTCFGVHNYGLSPSQMRVVEDSISLDISGAVRAPQHESVALIGDFNLELASDRRVKIDVPTHTWDEEASRPLAISHSRPFQARWGRIFDSFMEVRTTQHTHFISGSLTLNRIDRAFIFAPRSAMPHTHCDSGVVRDPVYWYSKRLSDHCPLFLKLQPRLSLPPQQLRLKPAWCKHPAYVSRLEALCAAGKVDEMPVNLRSPIIKGFMRDAALKARDVLLATSPESSDNQLLRLNSISRAIWNSDSALAEILVRESDLGKQHLLIAPGQRPSLKDPAKFEETFRVARESHLGRERVRIIAEGGGGDGSSLREHKTRSRLRVNSDLSLLWDLRAPKICITGLRITASEANDCGIAGGSVAGVECDAVTGDYLVRTPDEQAKVLAIIWGKVFGRAHQGSSADIDAFLAEYARKASWDWACPPPTIDAVTAYLAALTHCSPGKDGIINAAWKYGGSHVAKYIADLLTAHINIMTRPADINDGLFIFIPKTTCEVNENDLSCVARPLELRPLTLKNGDNKAIAGITNWAITPVVKTFASKIQRGFVKGRQLVQNVVDLDFESRASALRYAARSGSANFECDLSIVKDGCVGHLPVLILFDFAAAFPSVAHSWIRAVLICLQFPRGILNVFDALYTRNEAYWECGGVQHWLFTVVAGVLQGCPLSGSLFVIAIDPLLFLFSRFIVDPFKGRVAACADDIGVVLQELSYLPILQRLFGQFKEVAGLSLKPIKCVLVPLSIICKDCNKNRIIKWLSIHASGWEFFTIESSAKYLGFFLGPNASEKQWAGPIAKFKERTHEIWQRDLPPPLSAARFNSRAVSVLGYIAQLVPPPSFSSSELAAGLKVLGFATNSLNTGAVFSLDKWGGIKLVQPTLYMHACRVRAALKTLSGFEQQHKVLIQLSREGLPIASSLCGNITPEGWKGDAFCTHLVDALRVDSLPLNSDQRAGINQIISDFRNGGMNKSVQGQLYKSLHSRRSNDWSALLERRAALFAPGNFGTGSGSEVMPIPSNPPLLWQYSESTHQEWTQVSKTLSSSVVLTVLKTWANSWCTTSRYHEDILWPCIFGCCGAKDELAHYLCCIRFWSGICESCDLQESLVHVDPLIKMSLANPSSFWAKLIAVASRTYHAIKFDQRELVQSAVDRNEFSACLSTLQIVAKHFATEIGVP